jgi:hypothetical protein
VSLILCRGTPSDRIQSKATPGCLLFACPTVALKDFLTLPTKLRPILLKALLYGHVIAQLSSAKARGVSGACLLLLWRALMSVLSKTIRVCQEQRDNQKHVSHSMIFILAKFAPASSHNSRAKGTFHPTETKLVRCL